MPVNLYVFGDVHRFAKGCAEDKWLQFLDIAKHDPNPLFLGMGDYDDFASMSERAILINPGLHDDTRWTIDDIYTQRNMQFSKEIGFMRGKIIGLVEGNHYGVYSTGSMTTTQELCNILKCRWLGVNAFIRVSFHYKLGGRKTCLDIFAHHGRGASRMVGSSLSTVEQMASNAEADIYLMGHDHKLGAIKIDRLHLQGNRGLVLKDKTMLLARSGSFLQGYVPDRQSYVVKAGMKPAHIGFLKIILTPVVEKKRDEHNKLKETFTIKMEAVV